MSKRKAWKVEPELVDRFLNVLADNGFKWMGGYKANQFKPMCSGEATLFIEESPKVISYTEYYLYVSATREEYNVIEVTEEMLRGMESVLQNHALRDNEGVFKPRNGQCYWIISGEGKVYKNWWNSHPIDHNHYAIGNYFPTEQSAEDTVRVLRLIQKAKESQDGFAPDWEYMLQDKYSVRFFAGDIEISSCQLHNEAPMLGYWEYKWACEQFVQENHEELLWFFTQY